MRNLTVLSTIALLSLPCCVPFRSAPISAGGSASAFAGRSLQDAGLTQFLADQRAASGGWTVDRLALAAAYFQGDVRIARAAAAEAEAGVSTAGARPNPVLSFAPAFNASSSGVSPWILTPALDVTVETAGKRGKRTAQAMAEAEAARLRVSAAAWDARTKVRTAMLELYSARENQALLAAEGLLHEDALRKLEAQVKAGEAPAFEITQARLALNRSKLARHDSEKLAATSMAQLAAAVGVPASALEAVELRFSTFESSPEVPGGSARRKALIHRSDLLAALADYAATDAALRLEIAKQYPDVHLNPGYEFDQGTTRWALGVSLELPVLNKNQGPIKQAEAKRLSAGAKFEAAQAQVIGEVETALAACRAARAKVHTAGILAEQAAHASATSKSMVAAGEITPLELTRRRIEASASALSLLESRIQAQEAAGKLEAALQLPLRSHK